MYPIYYQYFRTLVPNGVRRSERSTERLYSGYSVGFTTKVVE